jgi:hypothetical protein
VGVVDRLREAGAVCLLRLAPLDVGRTCTCVPVQVCRGSS